MIVGIGTRNAYDFSLATTYTMAEMERLTRLNGLNDKGINEKDFGPVLEAIVKSLNVSVSKGMESLKVAYKLLELVKSPMTHLDKFTFLPPLWSQEDYLRPLILQSRGRKTGNSLFNYTHWIIVSEWCRYRQNFDNN